KEESQGWPGEKAHRGIVPPPRGGKDVDQMQPQEIRKWKRSTLAAVTGAQMEPATRAGLSGASALWGIPLKLEINKEPRFSAGPHIREIYKQVRQAETLALQNRAILRRLLGEGTTSHRRILRGINDKKRK